MNATNEYCHNVSLYLDGELRVQELEDFRVHLRDCRECNSQLEKERTFSGLLQRSRPLYAASDELRARIISARQIYLADTTWDCLGRRFLKRLRQPLWSAEFSFSPSRVIAGVALAFAFAMLLVPPIVRHVRAAEYIDTALTTYRSYLGGELPLEIKSNSPEVVTAWFAGKLPFNLHLSSSGSPPEGQPAYQQVGAGLVNYRGGHAAWVTYAMKSEQISLLVVSNKYAVASGGEEIRSGALTFHYHTRAEFNVITWSSHGLTYALVSSLHISARQSCLVCHQGMAYEKVPRGRQPDREQ